MSTDAETCPTCGGRLKVRGGGRSVCPRCLLEGTVAESASEISATSPPVRIDAPELADLQEAFPELELIRLLGIGGMGIVYEAVQKALGRKVALKILRLESVNLEFAERFQREAMTLARLSHPNIVSIFDQGERDGWVFILMEFVEGSDLSRLMDAGALSVEQSIEIANSICDALEHAHSEGVIHRDIKPANVLLDRGGAVKIADFGLAKFAERQRQDFSLTTGGSSLGTPLYMAPEQRKSSATADERADVYSLGVVLYEMLTGELPIGRVRPPSESAEIPMALDEVVLKGIEPDPERRFGSVGEMRSALGDALDGRRSRKRMVLVSLLLGLVVVVGIASAVLSNPGRDRDQPPIEPAKIIAVAEPAKAGLPEIDPDSPGVISLSAEVPVAETYFGSIIEASADILVVGYCKTEPLDPADAAPGEVYVYQSAADGSLSTPTILRAQKPERGDHFGRYVGVSPQGDFIGVVSSVTSGEGAANALDEPLPARVTVFERELPGGNQWRRAATFEVEGAFTTGDYALRIRASADLITLGSPDFDGGIGAVRIYERREGEWRQLPDLIAGGDDQQSKFGATSVSDSTGKFLVVAANTFDVTPRGNQGKVVVFRRGENVDDWVRIGDLRDEDPNKWEWFGLEVRASGDWLAVSVPGDRIDEVIGAGGIAMFRPDPTQAVAWRHATTLRPPLATPQRVGFGGRFDLADGWLAAMTLRTEEGSAHSLIYVARQSEGGDWDYLAAISGAPDKRPWLGRVVLGDDFVACGHVEGEVDGKSSAGKVYVFPKKLFEKGRD